MAHYMARDLHQRLYSPPPINYANRAPETRKWWRPNDEAERRKFESWKKDVKTFLTICKDGINVRKAYGEMADSMEGEIPYKTLRFNNFGEFLFHCDDILEVRSDGMNGYYLFLRGRPLDEAKHLRDLVVGQEKGKQRGFRARVSNTKPVPSGILTRLLCRSELDVCKPPPSMRGRRGGRGRGLGRGRGGGRGLGNRNFRSLPPRMTRSVNLLQQLRPYNPNDYAPPPVVKAVEEAEFDDEDYYEEGDYDDFDYDCPEKCHGDDEWDGKDEDFVDSCQNSFTQKTASNSVSSSASASKPSSISKASASSASSPSVFSRLGPTQSESVKIQQPLRTVEVKSQAQKNYQSLTSSVPGAAPAAASKSESFYPQKPPTPVSSSDLSRSTTVNTKKPLLPTPTVATSASYQGTAQVTRVPAATLVESRAPKVEKPAMTTNLSLQHAAPLKPSPAPSIMSFFQAPKTSSTTNVIPPATSVAKSTAVGSSAATSRIIYYQDLAKPTKSDQSQSTFNSAGANSTNSQAACNSVVSKSGAGKANSNAMTAFGAMWASAAKYSVTQQNGMLTSATCAPPPAPKPLSALTLPRTSHSKADMKSHPMNPFAAKINGVTSSFGSGGLFQVAQRNDMSSGGSQNSKTVPEQKVSCDNPAKEPISETRKNILKENNSLVPPSKSGAEIMKPSPKNIMARQMNIPKDKEFDARLVGADGFGFFFIHLINNDIARGYEQLRKEIRDFYSSKDIQETYRLNPSEIKVGMMVVAKVGGTYVRAQIDDKDTVAGLCIIFELEDHSFETVKFENLYQIEKRFSVRCSQAIMCCLSGLEDYMMTGDIADAFETTPLYPPDLKVKWIQDSPTYGLPVVQMTIFEDQDVSTLIKKYGGRHLKELKTEAEKAEREKFQQHQIDILRGKFYVM